MWFPIYPPTLRIKSDAESFNVSDDLFPKKNTSYVKPVGDRGIFVNMYGDYPIENLRFADKEADAAMLTEADLSGFQEKKGIATDSQGLLGSTRVESNCNVESFRMNKQKGTIATLSLFGTEGRLLKDFEYEYDDDAPAPGVVHERVSWGERPIKTGFRDGSVNVNLGGRNFEFSTFLSTYESGGRAATVDFRTIALGSTLARLPVRITVRTGQNGDIVRCAQMTNFHLVQMTPAEAARAAVQFASFSGAEEQYRTLVSRYSQTMPYGIEATDVSMIKRLCRNF